MGATEFIIEPGKPDFSMRRIFDAPRELVYAAYTQPEHLVNWWGPKRHRFVSCEVDLRVGGKYRFVQRGDDGEEFAFSGEFLELVPPEKIVQTFIFEPMGGPGSIDSLTLTEHDGKTLAVANSLYPSVEERDDALGSGMEEPVEETYDRLDAHLASLLSRA